MWKRTSYLRAAARSSSRSANPSSGLGGARIRAIRPCIGSRQPVSDAIASHSSSNRDTTSARASAAVAASPLCARRWKKQSPSGGGGCLRSPAAVSLSSSAVA
eukprot:9503766-Pyramimonas_sp.AAC.3